MLAHCCLGFLCKISIKTPRGIWTVNSNDSSQRSQVGIFDWFWEGNAKIWKEVQIQDIGREYGKDKKGIRY